MVSIAYPTIIISYQIGSDSTSKPWCLLYLPLWHGSLRLGMWRMLRTATKKFAAMQYAFRACSGLVTIATRPVVQHGGGQLKEVSGADVMSGVAVVQTAQRVCIFGYRPNAAAGPSARIWDKLRFTMAYRIS